MQKLLLFKNAEKIYGVKPNAIGDMRYITVPYSIAWLDLKLDCKLDLYKIWKQQSLSDILKSRLEEVMFKVEDFIKLMLQVLYMVSGQKKKNVGIK